jgi:two-component system NtrC family sensor kinase
MAERILIVDDEPDIVELLEDILTGAGYVVDAAPSASGALELIRENIYDAAILDFNLPDMDGVMLHRQLRQMDPELAEKSMFTSGLVQSDENLGYYTAQAAGFLPKPFDVDQVLTSLRALLDEGEGDDGD